MGGYLRQLIFKTVSFSVFVASVAVDGMRWMR
jgi:hypothetical protein